MVQTDQPEVVPFPEERSPPEVAPGDSGILSELADVLAGPASRDNAEGTVVTGGEALTESGILAARHAAWRSLHPPERLDRHSHYLVCSGTHLVATWENNGRGWMLHTSSGMVVAARNLDKLPSQGDFTLVELKLVLGEDGHRLEHITSYQLGKRWALTRIEKGDDKILGGIIGPGCLNRDQKTVVRNQIRAQFMREVWEKADRVLAYLGNTDFHSSGV